MAPLPVIAMLFILLLVLAATPGSQAKKKKNSKEWNQIDKLTEDDLDKDAEKELSLLEEIELTEKKREKRGMKDKDNGPMILFVSLKPKGKKKKRQWKIDEMNMLSSTWMSILQTASLVSEIRPFSENELLVKILHGWMIADIQKYILRQPETLKILRDKKDIWPSPSDLSDDEDDL